MAIVTWALFVIIHTQVNAGFCSPGNSLCVDVLEWYDGWNMAVSCITDEDTTDCSSDARYEAAATTNDPLAFEGAFQYDVLILRDYYNNAGFPWDPVLEKEDCITLVKNNAECGIVFNFIDIVWLVTCVARVRAWASWGVLKTHSHKDNICAPPHARKQGRQ